MLVEILGLFSHTSNKPDLSRVALARRRPASNTDCLFFVLVLNLQMDYLRTSQLETLEGSIGRIQVSILGMLCIVLTKIEGLRFSLI